MDLARIIEYSFFFAILVTAGYFVWLIFAPFLPALALSAVVVTICYPLYELIRRRLPRKNETLAAALTSLIALTVIMIPVFFVSMVIVGEVRQVLASEDFLLMESVANLETTLESAIPNLEINLAEQMRQGGQWFASNLGAIFAGTASTLFLFLISLVGIFYGFKDGARFTRWLVKVSPLPDNEDQIILARLGVAIRSVVTGVILVSIIQGFVAAAGFSLFGIERAVLWASVAAILALLPGIGTSVIMIPAIIYLFVVGSFGNAIGLLIWAALAVIVIDNFIGPYLMSRGNRLHPFVILLSVLGGITLFGPIGFVIGPVIMSLFMVLLEIYGHNHGAESQQT